MAIEHRAVDSDAFAQASSRLAAIHAKACSEQGLFHFLAGACSHPRPFDRNLLPAKGQVARLTPPAHVRRCRIGQVRRPDKLPHFVVQNHSQNPRCRLPCEYVFLVPSSSSVSLPPSGSPFRENDTLRPVRSTPPATPPTSPPSAAASAPQAIAPTPPRTGSSSSAPNHWTSGLFFGISSS